MKLAIGHIENQVKIKERELADATRGLEQCQAQSDDASDRVTLVTGTLNELRAALNILKSGIVPPAAPEIDITNLASASKTLRLEKRRA